MTYRGKSVSAETTATAIGLLDEFNDATGRRLGSVGADGAASPALRQVIGAMQARPEVDAGLWEEAIRRTVASPPQWVDGPVQLGHVFGERAAEWALDPSDRSSATTDTGRMIEELLAGKAAEEAAA